MDRPFECARRRWPLVLSALRRGDARPDQAARCLYDSGYIPEAMCLESPKVLETAAELCQLERCLTALDASYPKRWIDRLGDAAPPALWIDGPMPSGPTISIVGSRHPRPDAVEFARELAECAVARGYAVMSGGANGIDLVASTHAPGASVAVLPHGRAHALTGANGCTLSVAAPNDGFATGLAMERNRLIYAASPACIVIQPRFLTGGTWQGAVDCVRRRHGSVWVWNDGSEASRALISLGAVPIKDPKSWPCFIERSDQYRLAI